MAAGKLGRSLPAIEQQRRPGAGEQGRSQLGLERRREDVEPASRGDGLGGRVGLLACDRRSA